MKKNKNKIIAAVVVIILLAFAFLYGGNSPGLHSKTADDDKKVVATQEILPENQETKSDKTSDEANLPSEETNTVVENDSSTTSENNTDDTNDIQDSDISDTEPVTETLPLPVEPENSVISDKENTCILSVRCDTILNNIEWLDKNKVDIVPKDGIIYAERVVTFYEGESVFNLLVREMKQNKIHMEFVNTPIYNSAYIEGIANLYEFDCGELSGWMYKVNGWFPNYGCSRYQLKPGDKVEWVYTCDLGKDVGGHYSAKNGN